MEITVTELTNDVETHRMVVEADKATITDAVGKYIQQRVRELGLVLDYCLYLTPEGKQVRFPLSLELTNNQEQEDRHQWAEGRGYGNFPKEV